MSPVPLDRLFQATRLHLGGICQNSRENRHFVRWIPLYILATPRTSSRGWKKRLLTGRNHERDQIQTEVQEVELTQDVLADGGLAEAGKTEQCNCLHHITRTPAWHFSTSQRQSGRGTDGFYLATQMSPQSRTWKWKHLRCATEGTKPTSEVRPSLQVPRKLNIAQQPLTSPFRHLSLGRGSPRWQWCGGPDAWHAVSAR